MNTNGLAYTEISSSGTQADQLTKTLTLVKAFEYRTARELANKVNGNVLSHDAIHKRLPELRRRGLVWNPGIRVCTVTNKKVYTWAVA